MLFFQYLAKLLASLKNWGCSLMYFGSNKALNMAKYEQFACPPTKKLYNHAISWQISFKFCRCSSYGAMTIWEKFRKIGKGDLTNSWELTRNGPFATLSYFEFVFKFYCEIFCACFNCIIHSMLKLWIAYHALKQPQMLR